jgi:hypothetical protein
MKWWHVSYDFRRPHWLAFGRVAFIRAETFAGAEARARRFMALVQPGAEIVRVYVTASDRAARLRFWRLVQANWTWKRNVATGVPNHRGSL